MKNITKGLMLIFFFAVGPLNAAVSPYLAEKGKEYLQTLYQGGAIPFTSDAVVAISHYIDSLSRIENGGVGFASGTIVIEDPGKKLLSFLLGYVRKNFPGGDMCSPPIIAGSDADAYSRLSTHYIAYLLYMGYAKKVFLGIKKRCEYMHYGMDFKKGSLSFEGKKHILFGSLGEIGGSQFFFLRPEGTGLRGIQQSVIYLGDLIKKRVLNAIIKRTLNDLKVQFESTLAKDSAIKTALKDIKLVPDDINSLTRYRREGIPVTIAIKFFSLFESKDNNLGKIEKKNLRKKVNALGIRGMVETSKELSRSSKINPKLRTDFENLAVKIMKQYPDWPFRQGNEIILEHKKILPQAGILTQ